jgi:hypothetical protein
VAADKKAFWLLMIGAVVHLLAYNLWSFTVVGWYDTMCAIAVVFYVWAVSLMLTNPHRIIADVYLSWCIGNVIDELFFNPTKFEWDEYLFAAISLAVGLRKLYKWKLKS